MGKVLQEHFWAPITFKRYQNTSECRTVMPLVFLYTPGIPSGILWLKERWYWLIEGQIKYIMVEGKMVLTNWGADKIRSSKTGVNPFHATGLFLYHLKTSKTFDFHFNVNALNYRISRWSPIAVFRKILDRLPTCSFLRPFRY